MQSKADKKSKKTMSGRFGLRMPQSLHQKAALLAERDGVDLNLFINVSIARYLGMLEAMDNVEITITPADEVEAK